LKKPIILFIPSDHNKTRNMLKNYILGAFIALAATTSVVAQTGRNCGTMEQLHEMEKHDPQLKGRMEAIERETRQWISTHSNTAERNAVVITIPVVVHVLYNTAAQNISDAQINSQIAVLNADFRKLNSDISLLPGVFGPLAADCEIQFCLAQRDPSGNPSNGIVRRSTTVTSFSSNNNIKYTSFGGSDAWPSSSYLNMWVGNLSSGLLGYAQFPGGAAASDGVVINYTAFGTTGTAAFPFNKGRTATHEVGHWLNLRHIWGDANCGDDQVTDTPTQQTSNYGCPTFPKVSCNNGPNGDLHMNYMDYTDDACMYMFTNGQKSRMLAILNGTRVSLQSSQGCVPPSPGSCGVPSNLAATTTTSSANLSWTAVFGAQSYNVQYRLSNSTTWTTSSTTTNSLALSNLPANTAYSYQVQAVCSAATSAYSAAATFTTGTTTPTCSDIYETNESRTKAKTIALNTDITARIGSSTDKDWFKFTTTSSAPRIKITLDNLPADYDIRLYNSSGTQLGISQLTGTTAETIIRNATAGATYAIQVYGFNGAFNANLCYRLRVSTSSTNFRLGEETSESGDNLVAEKAEGLRELQLYPNPASEGVTISFQLNEAIPVRADIIDMLGKTIMTTTVESVSGFNKSEFNTGNLHNGIYFIRLQYGEEFITRKFIVKH